MMDRTKWNQRTPTSWIAVTALLVFACFWVACGGGAGSVNSTGWNAITPPKLTGISPATGPTTGDTTVAITGTDIQMGATVLFGNVPAAQINSVTSTSIEAVTPVHDPGNVDVKITNPDTRSDTLLAAFAFEGSPPPIGGPAPTISSVLPNSGPVVGGTVVTITGTDFQSGATVTFGQTPAAVVFSSATQLLATTPAHAPGTVDVIVRNPDTQSAMVSGGFTYQPVPAPTTISLLPTSGPEAGGTLVTVWGTNFLAGATVSFGGVAAASVTVTSATQLGAVTPPHAAGVVDVRVTNPDDQFATLVGAFTYGTPPPAIISISPSSGTIAGDTSVTITGTGFQPGVPGTTVTFGAVAGTGVNVLSSTKIQVTTPAHAVGAVDVRVTNPDSQSATLAGGYTYVTSPVIAALSVDSGLSIGGTPVTIRGSNFAGGATVTFGAVPAASVNVVNSTQIDVTSPPQPAGTIVDVTVTNPDTQQGTLPSAFRYGQVVFQSGLETGDFSEWKNSANPALPPAHEVVTNDQVAHPGYTLLPEAVYAGAFGAKLQYRVCGNPIITPGGLTGQTAGGTLGTRTYYVKYTYANGTGETGSATNPVTGLAWETMQALSANNVFTFASPPTAYQMTKYNVYVGTAPGNETLQNATPLTIGSGSWTEPASCPGTCYPGTNLTNTGAAPPSVDTNNAGCGAAHHDAGTTLVAELDSLYPDLRYTNGLRHFFIRGYVKFHMFADGALQQQRKLFYLKSPYLPAECAGYNDCWHVVLGGAPETSNQLSMVVTAYAGTKCDGTPYTNWGNAQGIYVPTSVFAYSMDTWYSFEVEVKANDPPNTCSGAVQVWVSGGGYDQKLIVSVSPLDVGGDRVQGVTRFLVGQQVDRFHYKPIDEDRYWDDVVVGDAYIGPQVPPP